MSLSTGSEVISITSVILSPHCCCRMGERPVYVKDQMGHSSIQIIVDQYGHLIPGGNLSAVDRLDNLVEERALGIKSATPAEPRPVFPGPTSSDRLGTSAVAQQGRGVGAW